MFLGERNLSSDYHNQQIVKTLHILIIIKKIVRPINAIVTIEEKWSDILKLKYLEVVILKMNKKFFAKL